MNLSAARAYIKLRLAEELAPDLYYHGMHHVEDVVASAMALAKREGITNPTDLLLLETAAWYHDAGFMVRYQDNEIEACKIAEAALPKFGYDSAAIAQVSEMIMATKLPQNAQSRLAEILCDADLDYLGRDDFEPISDSLFQELRRHLKAIDRVEWDNIQVKFLEGHTYYTSWSQTHRTENKAKHLAKIKLRLGLK